MKKQQYTTIIYFIGAVIAATLAIQVYWNYKNYQAGKAQLIRDVQGILDKAIGDYYDLQATQNTRSFFSHAQYPNTILESNDFKNLNARIDSGQVKLQSIIISDDTANNDLFSFESGGRSKIDSLLGNLAFNKDVQYSKSLEKKGEGNKKTSWKVSGSDPKAVDSFYKRLENNINKTGIPRWSDSLSLHLESNGGDRFEALQNLTTKIILSFNERVDVTALDSLLQTELERKEIKGTAHELIYTPVLDQETPLNDAYELSVTSSSALLPENSELKVGFNNIASIVFKRNLFGILLSIVLLGAVISSLLYLLKIIRDQKALAEIKNDFISNITHEFKTPIATIGVALESIEHFNTNDDPEKTRKYVNMSSQQISKLNIMVEKLLDTATLDSNALVLNVQEVNLYDLLESIQQKYIDTQDKNISLKSASDQLWLSVDAFHLENALDNIVDNAIKYGGQEIKIELSKTKQGIRVNILDNGNSLTKVQASQIFEKFYRVPKGNTHDVKGFGIGLYYTKTIVEKHGGTIAVDTNPTAFKIILPYV